MGNASEKIKKFLEKNILIFTLANPILYRLSLWDSFKTTPRPPTGLGDALGLASLRTSRASSGLMCVEVRLKEIYDHISFTL